MSQNSSYDSKNERKEIKQATILITVALYIGFIYATFNPKSQATFAKAFGQAPFGIPCLWFARVLLIIVLAPVPLVIWHLGIVLSRWRQNATGVYRHSILLWVLYGAWRQRDLRRSYLISIVGQAYFILIVAAWILYAEYLGL